MVKKQTDCGMTSDMVTDTTHSSSAHDIWLISNGRQVDYDLSRICEGATVKNVIEYQISDLARYLLNPHPIKINKKLIGCEIHYHQSSGRIRSIIKRLFPKWIRGQGKNQSIPPDVLITDDPGNETSVNDKGLESHLTKIYELLRPYDTVIRQLSRLDTTEVSDIVGVCRDIGGNNSYLNIPGSMDEKIAYMRKYVSKDVEVVLDKAHVSEGLFEMKGFNFKSSGSLTHHWLIKFVLDDKPRACVLNDDSQIEYWIDDTHLIHYLQLFRILLNEDQALKETLNQCTAGKAEPFKLFFNRQLAIDYSENHLPVIYQEAFEKHNIESHKKNVVVDAIGKSQLGISFHYVPQSDSGEKKICTDISVMHNIQALESIKDDLPMLYSEINKRASTTEAGRYYLMDTVRGYKNGK